MVINPKLKGLSEAKFELWDDCMSFPNLLVHMKRYQSLSLHYLEQVWKIGGDLRTHPTRILPSGGRTLYHASDGWKIVSVEGLMGKYSGNRPSKLGEKNHNSERFSKSFKSFVRPLISLFLHKSFRWIIFIWIPSNTVWSAFSLICWKEKPDISFKISIHIGGRPKV